MKKHIVQKRKNKHKRNQKSPGQNSKIVVSILHKIKRDLNAAIIFTTHNNKIGKTADRVTVIRDGEISEEIWNDVPLAPEDMDWGVEV